MEVWDISEIVWTTIKVVYASAIAYCDKLEFNSKMSSTSARAIFTQTERHAWKSHANKEAFRTGKRSTEKIEQSQREREWDT